MRSSRLLACPACRGLSSWWFRPAMTAPPVTRSMPRCRCTTRSSRSVPSMRRVTWSVSAAAARLSWMAPACQAGYRRTGDSIFSSLPGGTYGADSGTSMAGPHLVGVVALMWAAIPPCRRHRPHHTDPDQDGKTVYRVIRRSVCFAGNTPNDAMVMHRRCLCRRQKWRWAITHPDPSPDDEKQERRPGEGSKEQGKPIRHSRSIRRST